MTRAAALLLAAGAVTCAAPAIAQGARGAGNARPASAAQAPHTAEFPLAPGKPPSGNPAPPPPPAQASPLPPAPPPPPPRPGEAPALAPRPVPVPAWRWRRLPPPLPPIRRPEYERHWYGWQTLVADGSSVSLMIVGGALESGTLFKWGVAGYMFAAPIVHFGHGHVGKGFLSMGLRLGMPVAGVLTGWGIAAGTCPTPLPGDTYAFCGLDYLVGGGLLGALGAMVLDAAWLAREDVPVQRRLALSPLLGRDHAGLALSGTF